MSKITIILLYTLALLLPWHGVITVFSPEGTRYWKEVVVLLLLLIACWEQFRIIKNKGINVGNWRKISFARPIVWAILFLIWLGVLVLIDQNYYSIISARYLGLGFLVFILVSVLVQNLGKKKSQVFKRFSDIFIISSTFSVLFGLWGKFGGGFEVLKNFYSTTISSWVPGQTTPIYHQTADGFIRMQGGASGPVEFGHLLFVALFLLVLGFRFEVQRWKIVNYGLMSILFFGLYQSGSRSVVGGALLFFLLRRIYYWCRTRKGKKNVSMIDKVLWYSKLLLIMIVGLALLKGILLKTIPQDLNLSDFYFSQSLTRVSDNEHITRPLQAFTEGLEHPFLGRLGDYGPAARIRNLTQYNDDSAPIAENIFADYFVQMGVIGLVLALGFWVTLFFTVRGIARIFVGVSFLLVNMATLFDMTPLSLIFFTVFAFLTTKYSK